MQRTFADLVDDDPAVDNKDNAPRKCFWPSGKREYSRVEDGRLSGSSGKVYHPRPSPILDNLLRQSFLPREWLYAVDLAEKLWELIDR